MSTIHDDPAFPMPGLSGLPNDKFVYGQHGMSKRELFAAMAMQGLLSNLAAIRREGFRDRNITEFAVMNADALIAELAKERT
jgi:hypothetical protein